MNKDERLTKSSDLLRTFVIVADCQNITHAADVLGRTQSAISVQTRKLEDMLEVRLFERQARGMILTQEGEKLLPAARRIVSELLSISSLFERPLYGKLRVGIPDDFAETVLEHVLVRFSERHPLVEVSAQCGCTSAFPDAVRRGALDLAVVSSTEAPDDARIWSEPNAWARLSSLSVDREEPVPLAILDRPGCSWRRFATDALDAVGRAWRPAYASESFGGVKAAIRSGLAVGVLPRSLMEQSMSELSEADGFPPLPATSRSIITSQQASDEICRAMVEVIRATPIGS